MACTQTDSGKTVTLDIKYNNRLHCYYITYNTHTQSSVLIISPMRELTLLIYNEARKFTYNSIYRPVVIYEGTSVGHQLRQLEGGCNNWLTSYKEGRYIV